MAKKKQPTRHKISEEHNGKTYQAHYYVESGTVTVEAMSEHGTIIEHTTHVGASAEVTARMLLRELIDSGKITS